MGDAPFCSTWRDAAGLAPIRLAAPRHPLQHAGHARSADVPALLACLGVLAWAAAGLLVASRDGAAVH